MTEVIHRCDKCGLRIVEHRTLLTIETGPERPRRPAADLCSGCALLFWAWLDARPDASPA